MPTTNHACPDCGESEKFCGSTPMADGGTCCPACRARGYHALQPLELRSPEGPMPPAPMSRAAEDRTVAALLAQARAGEGDEVEFYDQPSVAAFRSLARSRGVDLETVIRAACRDELRLVVALPAA